MLQHHLIGDHSTLEVMGGEVEAILSGRGDDLAEPEPYRNAGGAGAAGSEPEEHEGYFRRMLADIDEPTLPFGLGEVRGDGSGIVEMRRRLPQELNDRLRGHARRLGVSLASLCHVAWGQVVARTSGREAWCSGRCCSVGCRRRGADRAMGLFINTLPLRLDLDGRGVEAGVRDAHLRAGGAAAA